MTHFFAAGVAGYQAYAVTIPWWTILGALGVVVVVSAIIFFILRLGK